MLRIKSKADAEELATSNCKRSDGGSWLWLTLTPPSQVAYAYVCACAAITCCVRLISIDSYRCRCSSVANEAGAAAAAGAADRRAASASSAHSTSAAQPQPRSCADDRCSSHQQPLKPQINRSHAMNNFQTQPVSDRANRWVGACGWIGMRQRDSSAASPLAHSTPCRLCRRHPDATGAIPLLGGSILAVDV